MKSHKGPGRQKQPHLPYCPTLGQHHMNWEDRHFRTAPEKRLRNYGAFILPLFVAPPPNHTLIHRSMTETPIPDQGEIEDILDAARMGGLDAVISTIDTRTTEHYRRQLFIASMPFDEAVDRLFSRQYVTITEMRGI